MRHSGLPIARLARLLAVLALGVGAASCGDDSSTVQRTAAGGGPNETSSEPGLKSYRDTRAETDASSDITNIVVSSDEAGLLSFKVTLAAEPDRHTSVLAYLDTDRNAATGMSARFGADYQLAASQLSQTDATFSLRRWNGRTFVDVSSVYPDVGLRGRVVTLGFANADPIARSFRFAVETQRRPRVALDRAPDPGQAPLTFELRGSSPANLSLGELTLTPTRPRAGRVLTASMGVQAGGRADVMNSIEDFVCSAKVGPRFLEALDSSGLYGVEGAATAEIRCEWRIPSGTSGKSVAGSVKLIVRGRPARQKFSAVILP
jgi:hypothetical protein